MSETFSNLAVLFQQVPTLFVALAFVIGAMVGSFLNVVIYRLPKIMEADFRAECAMMDLPIEAEAPARPVYNLAVPRSACPKCGAMISARDNIPVVSWLWLRGKCRHCSNPISIRYPLVELSTAALTALVAQHFGWGAAAAGAILLLWTLIALFWIDADTYLLPDSLTLPLLWAGLLWNLNGTFVPLSQAVVGAMAGYLSLWSIYWAFKLLRGKEGMGYGDFKLFAALGAWLGWKALLPIMLMAAGSGVLISVALIAFKNRAWAKPLPFGPYLAAGGLLCLLYGEHLAVV